MNNKYNYIEIKNLLNSVNLVNFISNKITLKKKGNYYYALCPFHKEKTPSFIVNENKNFFYCFGCKIYGNVINFLMYYERISFIESVNKIANICGVKQINNDNLFIKKKIFYFMKKINLFFINELKKHPEAYLYLKKRGLNDKIINEFEIGYSPNNINDYKIYFNFKEELFYLIKLGIIIYKNKKIFLRFKNRIMFPIKDIYGNILAFGGRIIYLGIPKYINSPNNYLYNKSYILYGLYEVLKNNNNINKIIIVEGYIDVIKLFQYGINYVVGILGSYISEIQIKLLFSKTKKIIFCYDNDLAGRKAAWLTLNKIISFLTDEREINFIFLPSNYDPDIFIEKIGIEHFEEYIKKSKSLEKWLINIIKKKYYNIKNNINLITYIINKIPSINKKLFLLKNTFDIFKNINIIKKNEIKYNIYDLLLGLIIQNPILINKIPKNINLNIFKLTKNKKIYFFLKLIDILKINNINDKDKLINFYKFKKEYNIIINYSNWNHLINYNNICLFFIDTIHKIYKNILINRKNFLIVKSKYKNLNFLEKKELWYIIKKIINKGVK